MKNETSELEDDIYYQLPIDYDKDQVVTLDHTKVYYYLFQFYVIGKFIQPQKYFSITSVAKGDYFWEQKKSKCIKKKEEYANMQQFVTDNTQGSKKDAGEYVKTTDLQSDEEMTPDYEGDEADSDDAGEDNNNSSMNQS